MAIFEGAGVALITPFHEDKSVNYKMLGTLLERQISNKTDAIIVCGTTGEPATMTEEERFAVIRYVVEKVNKRVPVIAGTGSNCTETAIRTSRKAEALGVDGLLIVTPYYNKATQKGLYEHYKEIAASVEKPIIMYNVPSRTGCNLLPETVVALAKDFKNISGIKEASGNISQVAKIASLGKNLIDIYSGNDDQVVPILSLGGKGVISVLANVMPQDMHDMVIEFLGGNVKRAMELQLKYVNLIQALFCEVNPIPVKAAMKIIGYEVGGVRLPLTEMEENHRTLLKDRMKEAGLIWQDAY